MEVFEAIQSGPAATVAYIGLLAALLKITKSLLEFHDEHLQKRPFKKLSFLAEECKGDAALTQLVSNARHEEVVRRVIGKSATPEFMIALSTLYATGKFTLVELRISSLYLKVVDGYLRVHLGAAAKITFTMSLLIILAMGGYMAVLIALVLRVNTSTAYLAALLLFTIYAFFFWYVGRDARAVYVAHRLKFKMDALQ